jgi:A/G-specific adenine glycosylase
MKVTEDNTLSKLPRCLLVWYDGGRRVLPWREDPTPYHVWISEIMLQQTRVEAVKPYYERFLAQFPDIAALAAAPEEALLKAWEGLGYYTRVRNLGKAANLIMTEYGGSMPGTYEEIIKLPGIGSYTAGAIASIAFGQSVPAVDGNVLRVYARVMADDAEITDAKVKRRIEEEFREIMPKDRPGDLNQSLMELGAMVCLPNGDPKCENCPLKELCKTGKCGDGTYASYPVKAKKAPRTVEEKTVLILHNDNKLVITRRPEKGLLAGMYEFPCMEGHAAKDRVVAYIRTLGLEPLQVKKLDPAKHIFTHREWHMTGYEVRLDELASLKKEKGSAESLLMVDKKEIEDRYPIPSAYAAFAKHLRILQGSKAKRALSAEG